MIKGILSSIVPDFEVRVFGSRIKGNNRQNSDTDIGILFKDDKYSYEEVIMGIMHFFEGQTVDIVALNHSDPLLRYEIISNYEILYCRDEEIFINFYINSIKQYNDIKKMLKFEKLYLQNFVGGMRSGVYQCNPPQVN